MNSKVKKLLSDTAVLGIGTLLSKLIVFFMLPLYTAYLSPEMYSVADLISQVANLIIPFACLGMTDAVFRFIAERERDKGTVLSSCFFSLVVGILVFVFLSPLLSLVNKFRGYAWLIAAYVVSAVLHSLFAQYVRAEGRTKLFAVQGIVNTLCTVLLNVLFLVVAKIGIVGYVLSVIVANLITLCFILLSTDAVWKIRLSLVDMALVKEMARYALPLIPTAVFWWITNVSDRYIVSYVSGDEINGLYAAAYKIPTLIVLVSAVFNEAWQYFAFSDKKSDGVSLSSEAENSYYFEKTFSAFSTVMMLACSFLMALSKPITDILLDSAYAASWRYTPMLLIATAYTSLVTFLSSTYAQKKKTVMSLVTAIIGAAINVVLNIILIPKFEAFGAAFATVVCYVTVFAIRSVNVKKYVNFRIYSVPFILSSIIIAAQCVFATLGTEYDLFSQILFFLGVLLVNTPVVVRTIKTLFVKN